jgi:hypothetical protein
MTVFAAACSASASFAQGPADPPPPLVTSAAWFGWYDALLASRLQACPLARPQTFYFSQTGSDSSGDGSQGNPWQTLAKAGEVLGAYPAGQIALLFRRGDTWRESTGIDTSVPNVTIADWGTGDKPTFTAFELIGSPSLWSPTPGAPNVYQRADGQTVTWANEDDDLDQPYTKCVSVSEVNAIEGSWWWDPNGVLYIHPRHSGGSPTDPRIDGKPYQLVRPHGPGVRIHGDGSRVQNIRAIGWGMTTTVLQQHGIDCQVQGGDQAVFVGCESYYGVTHCMTHWSAQGGIATFVDCTAGLTSSGSGESVFNTYASRGGNRTIFDHCEAAYGSLPNTVRPLGEPEAAAFYGHTDGGVYVAGLIVARSISIRPGSNTCARPAGFGDLPTAATLADTRCFVVGEEFDGGHWTGAQTGLAISNGARVNGRYLHLDPPATTQQTLAAWQQSGWVINCTLQIDCTEQYSYYSLYNPMGAACDPQFWHCAFHFLTYPGQTMRLDYTASSAQATLWNSVISCEGGGVCVPNLGTGAGVASNAYYGVDPAFTSADPGAVVLASPAIPGYRPACASRFACAAATLPQGVTLEYDQEGRIGLRNSIGPLQSPPCGNCDQSTTPPVLNVIDFTCFLQKFAEQSPDANCDGSTTAPSLNVIDFTCFLERFAAGCQ